MTTTGEVHEDALRDGWLQQARELAPLMRAEATAVERAGTLTEPVLAALREAGVLWANVPGELGGGGADIVTALRMMEEISRADGSIGWSLMANMTATSNACAFLPPSAVQVMFGDGLPIVAG